MTVHALAAAPTVRNARITRTLLCVVGAMLAGGAIRVYLAWTASVIARDAVVYVTMARRMAVDWRAELAQDYPLGFPVLIRWAHALIGRWLSADSVMAWQRSGQFVSLVFGVGCIPLVYLLGRRLLGTRCGLLAAWIWALLPQAAALSAEALTDMPNLALVLSALLCAMIGLRQGRRLPAVPQMPGIARRTHPQIAQLTQIAVFRICAPLRNLRFHFFPGHSAPLRVSSLVALFAAGLLSGAAYTMRTEGAAVVIAGLIAILIRPRSAVRWKLAAASSLLVGFAVLGGSYMLLEGKLISKQPWLLEESSAATGVIHVASAWSAPLKMLIVKLSNSLNGVWLIAGLGYAFLPSRRRIRPLDATAPAILWTLHTGALLWLQIRRGYISSRHVMLLNVAVVIFAAGTLAWLARYAAARAPGALRGIASRGDAVMVGVIALCLSPWLFRDINFNRFYIRDAARWIAEASAGNPLPGIVAPDGWVPFYAGATHWAVCRKIEDLPATAELDGAGFLVTESVDRPPARIRLLQNHRELALAEAARFIEPGGKRGVVIFRVRGVD